MSERVIIASIASIAAPAAVLFALGCSGGAQTDEAQDPAPEPSSGAEREPVQVQTGSIDAALAGAHRSEENRARDRYRHPQQTLEFFGLEPSMTVVEMSPGGGWYTEILAPVLRDQGRLIAAIPDPEESRYGRRFVERTAQHPEVFDQVETVIFMPPERTSLGPPGSADMVLTFRSAHGWIGRGQAEQVFEAIYEVLRPGGVLGLVQHRADDDADPAQSSEQGYVPEPYVIELAQNAGFVLEESSDINLNPEDTHDHPEGVWTLPPTLRLEDQDRERYLGIGESDRMTLRFRKPAEGEQGEQGDAEQGDAE